jgi:hypothetical protein
MDDEKQEKGFVIKDRRLFDETGEVRRGEDAGEQPGVATPPSADDGGRTAAAATVSEEDDGASYLPEVNFMNFILSLSTTAMFHFGDFPDPASGKSKKNMPAAKHTIDTITMLAAKTKGNLDENEKNILDAVLFELRMRYVKESGATGS